MNFISKRILYCLLITCLPAIANAATTSATITATVLPLDNDEGLIIEPRVIHLNRETRGSFRVENQTTNAHDLALVVREPLATDCRLIVTPLEVTLEPRRAQTFRLFYRAQAEQECRTRFTILIHVDGEEEGTVDVNCQ